MSIHAAMIEENLDQREGQPEPNSAGETGGGAVLDATPCSILTESPTNTENMKSESTTNTENMKSESTTEAKMRTEKAPWPDTLESRKAKRGHPLRAATGSAWERDLWAVEMRSASCRPEPMLIGDAWHAVTAPKYPGEPSRCLLFRTRKLAREWCVEATVKHAKHSKDWRFRPVRVRETVKPNDKLRHGANNPNA